MLQIINIATRAITGCTGLTSLDDYTPFVRSILLNMDLTRAESNYQFFHG